MPDVGGVGPAPKGLPTKPPALRAAHRLGSPAASIKLAAAAAFRSAPLRAPEAAGTVVASNPGAAVELGVPAELTGADRKELAA